MGFLTAPAFGGFLSAVVLVTTYGLALSVSVDFITGLVVGGGFTSGFFSVGFSDEKIFFKILNN